MLFCGKGLSPKAVWPRKWLTESLMADLAGNAMALPVLLAIVQSAVASLLFRPDSRASTREETADALSALGIRAQPWFAANLSQPAPATFVEASLCAEKDLQPSFSCSCCVSATLARFGNLESHILRWLAKVMFATLGLN